jgi:hypothetical protein
VRGCECGVPEVRCGSAEVRVRKCGGAGAEVRRCGCGSAEVRVRNCGGAGAGRCVYARASLDAPTRVSARSASSRCLSTRWRRRSLYGRRRFSWGSGSIHRRASSREIAPYSVPGPSRWPEIRAMSLVMADPCFGQSARLMRMSSAGSESRPRSTSSSSRFMGKVSRKVSQGLDVRMSTHPSQRSGAFRTIQRLNVPHLSRTLPHSLHASAPPAPPAPNLLFLAIFVSWRAARIASR